MELITLEIIQKNFLRELQDAYSGKKTSLPFIIHNLSSIPIVKNGDVFEALVIGGSIWKKALLQKTKKEIEIVKKETERSVAFKNEKDFLEFIDNEVKDNIKVLALNFAYPLKPIFEKGRLDGTLLKVTKEGSFHGLIGKKIGKEIEGYILKKRNKKITASVANDTVCLLLSGLTKYSFDSLAAGIVGTGLNFAFFLDKERLVNLESANFDKFALSQEASIIDKESSEPNIHLFEKETAGAYLYKHFNLIIKEKKINYPQISSAEELDTLSRKNIPQVSIIAQSLLEKSAQLVACQVAGITEFKQIAQDLSIRHSGESRSAGRLQNLSRFPHGAKRFWTSSPRSSFGEAGQNDNHESMVFNMEGRLFWKGNEYKETVEKVVKQLVPKYSVRFVEIKDSGTLGAAKLVS